MEPKTLLVLYFNVSFDIMYIQTLQIQFVCADMLRKTHRFIKHKLRLYEEYLGCTITFQEPDIYVFSFSNYDNFTVTVKFQYNDDSNWTGKVYIEFLIISVLQI